MDPERQREIASLGGQASAEARRGGLNQQAGDDAAFKLNVSGQQLSREEFLEEEPWYALPSHCFLR